MAEMEYTYAVARIRALELGLLSDADIDQLIASPSEEACMQLLSEKGWGTGIDKVNPDEMLKAETDKIWKVVRELKIDPGIYRIFSYEHLFHNLKAAIKEMCSSVSHPGIFFDDAEISGEEMKKILEAKDYSKFPDYMAPAAKEAYETLLQTRDGQLCDIIIDKATLKAIYNDGLKSDAEIIKRYVEDLVAIADIRIAVHGAKTRKSVEFIRDAMVECGNVSADLLAGAAGRGMDAICEYLEGTSYAEGAESLRDSITAFERWCDNRIIYTLQPEKYEAFTVGPVIAYILARENEIKTVRMILCGKANDLPEDFIRERAREMYV